MQSEDGIFSRVASNERWHARLKRFREVEHAISTLEMDVHPKYSVPRIIVIGEESSGKSSTLERIAMMQFFPTDRKLCTRMPIELRLRYCSLDDIHREYEHRGLPIHDSYVKMSVKRVEGSKLPEVVDSFFPPSQASEQIKSWMDGLISTGYIYLYKNIFFLI